MPVVLDPSSIPEWQSYADRRLRTVPRLLPDYDFGDAWLQRDVLQYA